MEGFTYTNIFETKGIEYLVILAFFAIMVPFWLMLNRKTKISKPVSIKSGLITIDSLRIPQGMFFSKFHTWAFLETNGEARVGIDDLLLHFTGNVSIENTKNPGDIIRKGDLLAKISNNGKYLRVLSPVTGEIMATNTLIAENPDVLKDDQNQLWIHTIKPTNWKAETSNYYLAEESTIWMLQELARFKDFLASAVAKYLPESPGVVLQDGGELLDQPLVQFPEEIWQEFQEKFLS
jgi:glycine cleavage system H protein